MEPMIAFQAPKPALTVSLGNPIVGSGLFSVDAPIHDADTVDQVAKRLLKVCRCTTVAAQGMVPVFLKLRDLFDLKLLRAL